MGHKPQMNNERFICLLTYTPVNLILPEVSIVSSKKLKARMSKPEVDAGTWSLYSDVTPVSAQDSPKS